MCPEDMVKIADAFCIDVYEASRPDADPYSAGMDESRATSVLGVVPWRVEDNAAAASACKAAGKRLCDPLEWQTACQGPDKTVYAYGDNYNPLICNGIDTFGRSGFHLTPTGSFPECANEWGVFDLNGNLWEHTANGSDRTIRGGAYNCLDSALLHRCDYIPGTWEPSARGFRCCSTPKSASGAFDTETDFLPSSDIGDSLSNETSESSELDTGGGGCIDDTGNSDADSDTDIDIDIDIDSDTDVDTHIDTNTNTESGTDSIPDGHSDIDGDSSATFDSEIGTDANTDSDTAQPFDTESVLESDRNSDSNIVEDTNDDSGAVDEFDTDIPPCPEDMVAMETFCIDRYEASHDDATSVSIGTGTIATSRPEVLPWFPVTQPIAKTACEAASKRLCRPDEWFLSCIGTSTSVYSYGDAYDPLVCNGIDSYCVCDGDACDELEECPYPHCYNQSSETESGGPCGARFHVMPTGSFGECTNEWDVYDINGNVWEIVESEDGFEHYRGGAYNCGDSELLHRCDYDATWNPSAKGFRCCKDRVAR